MRLFAIILLGGLALSTSAYAGDRLQDRNIMELERRNGALRSAQSTINRHVYKLQTRVARLEAFREILVEKLGPNAENIYTKAEVDELLYEAEHGTRTTDGWRTLIGKVESALAKRIKTNEDDIAKLKEQVAANETAIAELQGRRIYFRFNAGAGINTNGDPLGIIGVGAGWDALSGRNAFTLEVGGEGGDEGGARLSLHDSLVWGNDYARVGPGLAATFDFGQEHMEVAPEVVAQFGPRYAFFEARLAAPFVAANKDAQGEWASPIVGGFFAGEW